MTLFRSGRARLWIGCTLVWLVFTLWYTNTAGPLTQAEIDYYLEMADVEGTPTNRQRLRTFMESDTGGQFIMVNILHMADEPPVPAGAPPSSSADELLAHYMEYMYPALLRRASHPVFAGTAIAPAMDVDGIEGAAVWSTGALMRYRSRRDMLEIAFDPRFGDRHQYKLAALEKTIAFPVESVLYYADPRFLLALILFSIAAGIDLIVWRRATSQAHERSSHENPTS